jgi:hypothetical protein
MFASSALLVLACGGAASSGPPVVGKKRNELCAEVMQPPAFRCPEGSNKRGKPPPDGTEMWCERKGGVRHGPYRRFPPGAEAGEPAFVGDNVVVGEYAEDRQHGAWYSRRPGVDVVSVKYYQSGDVAQKIDCRP